ncbi:MAG: hypothetical protein PHZ02_07540 [Desulfocapsaceae bacterium]|nr:hypothetical protein [Desulfocapsaceae bacterium]
MKKSIAVAVAFASCILISAGTVLAASNPMPDLTGKWETKSYGHHHEERGFFSTTDVDGKWTIKEQQGRFFTGERTYFLKARDNKKITEGFSGVISRDGKHLYMVDHDEDILMGDILENDSIELVILNDGDKENNSRIGLIEIEKVK